MTNQFKNIFELSLPRLINCFNLDPSSKTFGYGDRIYWGWKTIDFTNGTFQGGVYSIAVAIKLKLIDKDFGLYIIKSAINAIAIIKHKNGSLVEAYPNEHSFCVTALVSFDVLKTIYLLENIISEKDKIEFIKVVRPLINFITLNNEEHGIISNHLATGAAAIAYWNYLTGENNKKKEKLLNKIFENQSSEGWYMEYEGPDPGYQTLCTHYLSSILDIEKSDKLLNSLKKSGEFLSHFIHPDGSIGGLYGSRNTEVYYPGGIVKLATHQDLFKSMNNELKKGINNNVHILPHSIDSNNLIPLMNSYAEAALYEDRVKETRNYKSIFFQHTGEKTFKKCGIYIHSNEKYYAIFNYYKGGTIKVFDKINNCLDLEDGGLYGCSGSYRITTQINNPKFSKNKFDLTFEFYKTKESFQSPIKNMLLRILSLTIFKSIFLGNVFKKAIVKKLMTGKNKVKGKVKRVFNFNENNISIKEAFIIKPEKEVKRGGKFKVIHMASSGYNFLSSKTPKSKFVKWL